MDGVDGILVLFVLILLGASRLKPPPKKYEASRAGPSDLSKIYEASRDYASNLFTPNYTPPPSLPKDHPVHDPESAAAQERDRSEIAIVVAKVFTLILGIYWLS